jgi:hypothetical protein
VKPSALCGFGAQFLKPLSRVSAVYFTLSVWPSVNPSSCVYLLVLTVYLDTGSASTCVYSLLPLPDLPWFLAAILAYACVYS